MAARYWVGGAATWDGTALLKWALTSGGLGGQAVPTSSDTVFFDAASGANTVTIGSGTSICSTLTMTGFTGTLAFGTNSITCAGSGTGVFTGATTHSVTGTPLINITGTGTLTLLPASVTEANSISFTINNAASNAIGVSGSVKNLTFAGTYTGNLTNGTRTLYGNLTLKSGMTLSAGASVTTFASTNATVRTITTNSNTLDFPITFNGVGGSWQLQDALTVGTSRAITLTNGSFDTNTKSLTCGTFSYNNTNTKTLTLGTSTVTITGGTSTSGFVGSSSGTTYDVANSTIVFTTTGSVVFAAGSGGASGTIFGTITMSGSGGTLYLGNSTSTTTLARCTTLNNTVSPCTITNSCTTAFTVTNFNVNGTAGNLVVLNSNTPATARTITKASGTTDVDYLNIQDSTATGGTWNAYSSTNSGNNTGWNFLTRNNGNFLMFF